MPRTRRLLLVAATLSLTGAISLSAQTPLSQAALLGEFTWRSIGPVNMGGRVDDIEAVESNPYIVYVGTAAGGVWKTENGGTTWFPVFDGQPTQSIGDLAIAPSDPDVVWVGTGENNSRQSTTYGHGVFKSTDGGRTWSDMGLHDSGVVGRIVIDPDNANVVYIAVTGDVFKAHPERGVYKTTDGGRTWVKSKFVDDDTGFIDLVMDPSDSRTLVAASYQRRRTTWGYNGGGPGSALWKTTDAGATWRRLEGNGLPPYGNWGRTGLAFSRSNPDVVYATIEPGPREGGFGGGGGANAPLDPKRPGIYRSDDKGESWRLVSNDNGRPMYFSQIRVDPTNPDIVFTLQRTLFRSDDGARTFSTIPEALLGRLQQPNQVETRVEPFTYDPADSLPPSHPDHHAMWIDPSNPLHILLGHDGGVDFSYDGGRSWQFQNAMPIGQFYAVAADMRQPYYLYGGLQDNGWWGGPSRVRNAGGITRDHWFELASGDGYHVQADPSDWRIVYGEVSGNGGQHVYRFNLETGEQKYIRPTPQRESNEGRGAVALPLAGNIVGSPSYDLRFNWNPGFAMSPHDPRTLYFGANRLFISHDRGDSWLGTEDLTKALDRDQQSIMGVSGSEPMTAKNDGVPAWGTIVTIAESYVEPGVLWVGTDDGNLQVSRDDGASWSNVADNAATFPGQYDNISAIEPSHFQAGGVFVAFDGHRSGDYRPHLYRTTDYGQSWTDVSGSLPSTAHVNVIRQDRFNPDLVFVGTEAGFYVSLDGARTWTPFMNDLPATIVDDALIHRRDQDLILATHGRSFYILDDITALQQLSGEVLDSPAHLFRPRPAILWREDKTSWHGGADDLYRAPNPPDAIVSYYLRSGVSGGARLQILAPDGTAVRELQAPGAAGIHRVPWDLRREEDAGGERVAPGTYTVRLTAGGRQDETSLTVLVDPGQ